MTPERFREIKGLRVHYRIGGTGPPVLLLHGWGGSSASFARVASELQQRFTVIAPDLPGFGLSQLPPAAWGSYDYADLVARLSNQIHPPPYSVLGHSFGGRIALALACAHPDLLNKLVLVDAAGIRIAPPPRVRAKAAVYRALRHAISRLPAGMAGRPTDGLRRLFGSSDYRDAGALRPTLVRLLQDDFRAELPRLRCPTLVIWGERDKEVPLAAARVLAREMPSAELAIIPGAGHFPFLEAPDRFCQLVQGFLDAGRQPG